MPVMWFCAESSGGVRDSVTSHGYTIAAALLVTSALLQVPLDVSHRRSAVPAAKESPLQALWSAMRYARSHPQLRDLLAAIEEKHRLVTLLNACIDAPEPVHVLIGVKEISQAGDNLALISAAYMGNDLVQGSLGVLGPTRMHYERAMTAVAYVAQLFSEALSKI